MFVGSRDALDLHDIWQALDAKTGEERWRLVYPAHGRLDYGNSPRATPTVSDDIVYFFGAFGHLHAVEIETGIVLWMRDLASEFVIPRLEWGLVGSPLLIDDKLIVQPGGNVACIVALNSRTGETIWQSTGGKPSYSSLIFMESFGHRQVVGYDVDSLGGWDLNDGRRLWSVKPKLSGDFNVPTPIPVGGDKVLLTSENNGTRLHVFNPEGKAEPVPTYSSDSIISDSHTPVVSEGRIYGVSGGLKCLDVDKDLSEVWTLQDEAFMRYASLVAAGRKLLVLSDDSELLLIEDAGSSPRVLSRLKLSESNDRSLSHPAIADRSLFVRLGKTIARLNLEPAGQ